MVGADELFDLLIPAARSTGAPRMAATVGATHLCIFIRDPERLRFLPAPGFCRTLPKGLQWAAFLREVERDGDKTGILPSPYTGLATPIFARLLDRDTISVLFGEGPDPDGHEKLRSAISVLSALELQELRTRLAEIQGALARTSAMESKRLAQSLSDVHDRLAATLQRTLQLGEELNRQQERLNLARKISGIGFWEYDAETQILTLSEQAGKIFGFSEADREIPLATLLHRVDPADRSAVQAAYCTAPAAESEPNIQFRLVDTNGRICWIENRGTLVRGSEAARADATIIGLSLDITHRIKTEESLIRSEKLVAAGRLAASVAHEINNPLEALGNLIYLARIESNSEMRQQYLGDAERELSRISSVARQTLGFYRDVNRPVTFDLCQEVRQVVDVLGHQPQRKSNKIQLCLPANPAPVHGWPGEMKQVVTNLIINSIRASDNGESISVRIRSRGNSHFLLVADRGHGIAAQNLSNIFEPFFSTRTESGNGLGLWVTRQIVEKHGGRVRVRSSTVPEHHGAVFQIRLPDARSVDSASQWVPALRDKWLELSSQPG